MADIAPGASGEFIVRDGLHVARLYAVAAPGIVWVFHDGVVYAFPDENEVETRRHAGGPESLTSPMPATVIKVNVGDGAQVRRGDVLVLLEAMKMELPVRAPADGRVTAVHCRAGDLVPAGAALVEIA